MMGSAMKCNEMEMDVALALLLGGKLILQNRREFEGGRAPKWAGSEGWRILLNKGLTREWRN